MSLFNLDRFRFDKKTTPNKQQQNGSISPESEKENKPARMRSDNSPMKKSDPKVFEDSVIVDSDTDATDDSDTYEVQSPVPKARVTPVKSPSKKSHHRGVVYEEVISDTDEEDRPGPEARAISVKNPMKSHLRRVAREDVITITSDTDEEERRNPNAKITLTIKDEEPASNSSNCDMEQSIEERVKKVMEIFPDKSKEEVLQVVTSTGTLDGAIAACIISTPSKKRQMEPSSSQDSDVVPPSKKMRPLMETSQDTDEEEEEEDPDWEKREAMVERLQKKFPDQEKKELKIVLEQHDWIYEDALETLIMFSDPDDAVLSSSESKEEKTNKSKEEHKSSRDRKHHKNSTHGKEASANSSSSSLSTWLTKRSDLSPSPTPSSSFNSSRSSTKFYSSTLNKTLSKFASATSIAKKEAEERKRKAHASYERVSSGEDDSENELLEPVSSEFEDSEDDLDSVEETSEKSSPREQIVKFFQEASLDELSLITSCSLKKAKKIVELRPFDSWESLKEAFVSGSGLNEDLLFGCRVVLKERMVVQGLMSKCETISSKMVKHVTQITENGTRGTKQPSILNSQLKLKPYQMIGLKWLLLLNQHKLSGILADEMGLGKTIQAIAFLAQLFQNGVEGPHLIVVPSSTLDNWVREFKLWCPNLEVLIYYGNQEDRRYIRRDILDGAVDFNVIVTTYNLAIGNHSDRTLFMKLRLNYAVFDEGHMLKNMNTLRYRNLMEINAEHRLLLTGTPLQNNLLELMSLLNFIMPSMFSSSTKQFTKMFSQKAHEEQSPFERDRIAQAKSIMKPFILRRVKSEVLKQLPDKEEIIEYCPMSEKQQTLYQDLVNKLKKSTAGEKRELCNVFMQLRKMANHPMLHRQYYTTEKLHVMSALMLKEPTHRDANADLIQEDMEVMSDFELHRLCQQYTSISSYQLETHVVLDSGKFHHLTELLASLKDKGDRVVLFSQFTMMLDIVEVLMRHLKHRYIRLDGQTPIADRIGLIDDFNTDLDIFVFLLSTKAGGLGINLTSANVVILHDIDFNPYNDKQAEDRCHRLGQTRTVKVIKLVHKDTIEDSMLRLGKKKLKLEQDMTAAEEGGEGTIPDDMATLLKASLGM